MSARGRKSANPLDKRIPENPKYKHVKATIDTGSSISKYMEKMEEFKRNYNFRKDEIFKRMKVSTFVQLVIQVFDYDDVNEGCLQTARTDRPDTADDEVARIQKGAGDTSVRYEQRDGCSPDTSRSRLEQVVNGMGEVDLDEIQGKRPSQVVVEDCPYLLLDVREQDAFDACRIITAKSYPTAMLARSVNYETKEMLKYKNQEGKIILVYDDDEKICHRAITTLVQRGYDNIFMLSGGLKVAYKLFPDCLISGTIPRSIWEEVTPPARKNKESPQKLNPGLTTFTSELVNKLTIQLDGALADNSMGSRLSKSSSSRAGRSSSLTSVSTVSSLGRKPFKF